MKKYYPINMLEDIFGEPWNYVLPHDIDGTLEYILAHLSDNERKLVALRYKSYYKLTEIAGAEGVTLECVRQKIIKALKKLKNNTFFDMAKNGIDGMMKLSYEAGIRAVTPASYDLSAKSVPDIEIEELNLSSRSYNSLKRAGINTLGQLSGLTFNELRKLKSLGPRSIREITAMMTRHGATFSSETRRA